MKTIENVCFLQHLSGPLISKYALLIFQRGFKQSAAFSRFTSVWDNSQGPSHTILRDTSWEMQLWRKGQVALLSELIDGKG